MPIIYYSHRDPVVLEECLCKEVETANQWYYRHGILSTKVNIRLWSLETPIILSPFLLKTQSIFLVWTLTSNLNLINIYLLSAERKETDQFNVMLRFRKLITKTTLLKIYKAFILAHFQFCSSVWHFCGARNTEN